MSSASAPLILVIDDDRAIGQALKMHLQFRGYAVDTVMTGRDGLDRLKQGDIDLLLCDIGLPDLSGHEVVKQAVTYAREHGHEPPDVVVMTANATLDNAISALREGADQFVTKPLSMPFLEVVVDRAMALRRLRGEVKRLQTEHTELVLQSLADLTRNLGLAGALESVLRAVVVLIRPTEAAIWLADPTEGDLRTVAVHLTEGAQHPGEPQLEAARSAYQSGGLHHATTSGMVVTAAPVVVDGEREGAVTICCPETSPAQWSKSLELLEQLAGFAANAVRKERLLGHLEQSSMQISSLFEVGLAMSSEVSLQRLFEVIVDSAERICAAGRCSLMLIDHDGETLRMRAARGIPADIVAKAEARLGEGIAGTVAATGEALFIADIERDGEFSRKNDTRYNNSSLVCVPIRVHDQVVGVLNVNNKQDGASFTENDLNLLTLLASQAAVALDNANRYQDLSEKAITDGLTGAYIRRYFDECLDRAYRTGRATGRGFSLLMSDIDHFKKVNDTYGHQTGDEALKVVSRILKEAVRDEDLVARYGGEEFAIILARGSAASAKRVAERVREAVEAEVIRTDEHSLQVTVSLGVATFDDRYKSPDDVIKAADQALYEAKESGRNRVITAGGPPE